MSCPTLIKYCEKADGCRQLPTIVSNSMIYGEHFLFSTSSRVCACIGAMSDLRDLVQQKSTSDSNTDCGYTIKFTINLTTWFDWV